MKKEIKVNNNTGVLDIKGSFSEALLTLNEKPIQFTWFAEVGTTWRYHLAKGLIKSPFLRKAHIETILSDGILNEEQVNAVIRYYKSFLKTGYYSFGTYQLNRHTGFLPTTSSAYTASDTYGGIVGIIGTQININTATVDSYKEQILKGKRPCLILFRNEHSHNQFVLDGHHKFLAYKGTKIKPHALIITKLNPKALSKEDALQALKKMKSTNVAYHNALKEEKKNPSYDLKLHLEEQYEDFLK